MKKNSNGDSKSKFDDLDVPAFTRAEMRRGVMGKYAGHMIGLDPDVARVFKDSESVNKVLRAIIATLPVQAMRRRKSA